MMETLTRPSPRTVAAGLAFLRIVIGLVFLAHGLQKLLQFFMPDGYELVLSLAGAALAITLAGPGALALDDLLARGAAIDERTTTVSKAGARP